MTTVLSLGKFRTRKDWSTNSIPTLVSLEEESIPVQNDVHSSSVPSKPPRRSSLAVNLMGGRGITDKHNKRRSSIAVAFLGRHNKVR